MSQNDLVIANQSFPATRADINSALQALGSLNSGSTAPATTYANMLWYDTANNTLKMRSEADDVWISVGYLNQPTDEFSLFDDTKVVNSSGTQTGLLGDQSTSAWEAGTGTTESLVSPAKVKAAIEELVPDSVGVGQTWQDVKASRTRNVTYQNTTGRAIQVLVKGSSSGTMQVSSNGSTWVTLGGLGIPGAFDSEYNPVIPDQHYYRVNGGSFDPSNWVELR
jgi:hypothetical protein